MENFINAIEKSLIDQNWYSALTTSLIMPDICSGLKSNKEPSSIRYSKWFDKYIDVVYKNHLTGKDCYSLRCSFLHEGSDDLRLNKSRDKLDYFVFIHKGSHLTSFANSYFQDRKYDGKNILQLSVWNFANDIINAVKKWEIEVKDDPIIQENISKIIRINDSFNLGNGSVLIK